MPENKLSPALRKRLLAARGFVLDMDGTLVLGDKRNKGLIALPGAADFVAELRRRRLPFVSFTNGTVRAPRDYVGELARAGVVLDECEIMTPASVAADFLSRKGHRRVLVLGGEGVGGPLTEAGLDVVRPPQREAVDAIFVGWFREFTMEDIETACDAVWSGARLYAASLAPFFATAQGRALGTSCAIVGAISKITGCRATLLGKPSAEALRTASRRLGVPTRDLAVIGDDPALEIPMALRGGALGLAVTTGVADRAAFRAMPRPIRPHLIVESIGAFLELYRTVSPINNSGPIG